MDVGEYVRQLYGGSFVDHLHKHKSLARSNLGVFKTFGFPGKHKKNSKPFCV